MQNRQNTFSGALLATLGGIGWGVSGAVGQYLFTAEHMDSRWLVPVRLGLAGIILLSWCFLRDAKMTLKPWKTRRDRIDLLIYGLAGISLCQFFYFRTIQLSSAAVGTILQSLSPILILIASSLLYHRMPHRLEILAVIPALLGVFLLSTHGDIRHLAIPGAALVTGILSAVCVMIYNVFPRQLLQTCPVLVLQGWAFLLGSVFFTFLFRSWQYPVVLNSRSMLGIAAVVLIGNLLAFPCYMEGVKRIGPSRAILYGFSEPVSTALLTVFWFHQPFGLFDFLGFALIFLAIVLISLPHREEPQA